MFETLRYLLLQVRNADDPMRRQEIGCFARALRCSDDQIQVYDLLRGTPNVQHIDSADIVLLGGSGDYSVAQGGPWLSAALETMRQLHEQAKPTFASCWGFQAMAKALGGRVVTDESRAELGTHTAYLTPAGQADPVFESLGSRFPAQMGHQDIVEQLPDKAILLASTDRVESQAFTFPDRLIYCTQFHPELDRTAFLQRLHAYPQYVERIAGITNDEFEQHCDETLETSQLLARFVQHVVSRTDYNR
jgi:GMP synthase (glutamine-hydrolysing)